MPEANRVSRPGATNHELAAGLRSLIVDIEVHADRLQLPLEHYLPTLRATAERMMETQPGAVLPIAEGTVHVVLDGTWALNELAHRPRNWADPDNSATTVLKLQRRTGGEPT